MKQDKKPLRPRAEILEEGPNYKVWIKFGRLSVITVINSEKNERKQIGYFGFETAQEALVFIKWIDSRGVNHYRKEDDSGWTKPRKAKRTEGIWEVKVHRAPEWLLLLAFRKEQSRLLRG